jgi:hypothetical protein
MCGVGAGQATMSKLNADLVNQSVEDLLAYSKGEKVTVAGAEVKGKVRKFTETVELQVSHYLQSHVYYQLAWLGGVAGVYFRSRSSSCNGS